jgi:uncharacterized Zn finger protein
MEAHAPIDVLSVAVRELRLEILYYCPECGSINEVWSDSNLAHLDCRECGQVHSARQARIKIGEADLKVDAALAQVPD